MWMLLLMAWLLLLAAVVSKPTIMGKYGGDTCRWGQLRWGLFLCGLSQIACRPRLHIVPAQMLGARMEDRQCLLAGSLTLQGPVNCTDDDELMVFRIARPSTMATAPPPPSRPLPAPVPEQPLGQMWYPFALTFRADWYPVDGRSCKLVNRGALKL